MIEAWRTASLRPAPIVVITCWTSIVRLLVLRSDAQQYRLDQVMAFNPAVRWRQCRPTKMYPCKKGVAVIVLTDHFGRYHIPGSVRVKTSLCSVGCCDLCRARLLSPASPTLLPRSRVSEDKVLAVRHLHLWQGLRVQHVLRSNDA